MTHRPLCRNRNRHHILHYHGDIARLRRLEMCNEFNIS